MIVVVIWIVKGARVVEIYRFVEERIVGNGRSRSHLNPNVVQLLHAVQFTHIRINLFLVVSNVVVASQFNLIHATLHMFQFFLECFDEGSNIVHNFPTILYLQVEVHFYRCK